jgi:UDP-glucose 4-epimerase
MKTLITGGAGFLGTALANRLVAEGDAVTVVDDLSTGDQSGLAAAVTFTRGDVRDVPRLWSLLAGVDVVYHMAAKVSVPESILYPVEYNAVNTGGTVSVMAACRDAGVRRVVLTSSGTVYGPQASQPIPETAWPQPANPYAVSKLAAEGYVQAIGELYRIETVVLRVFNAYGPGQAVPPNHPPVIPAFTRQILAGGSLVLYGSPPGSQTRDFVYLDDVTDALVLAGRVPGVSGAILNIGSGVETSLLDVVAGLEAASGRRAARLAAPEQSGGIARMCADIAAARAALGWQPRVPLAVGWERMVRRAR